MKSKSTLVRSFAGQLILNQPKPICFIESDGATMGYRLREPLITIMLGNEQIGRCAWLPINYSRPRFIANNKRCCLFNTVLFSTVNLNRRMISGRTKQMPLR